MNENYVYTARKFRNYYNDGIPFPCAKDIIFDIVNNSNYPMKKSEIYHIYKERIGAKDLDVYSTVTNNLASLVKEDKIAHVKHGIYAKQK